MESVQLRHLGQGAPRVSTNGFPFVFYLPLTDLFQQLSVCDEPQGSQEGRCLA